MQIQKEKREKSCVQTPDHEDIEQFDYWVRRLSMVLGILAAVAIMIMMIAVSADVIGRYIFNRPIQGAMELALLLMVVVDYLGLPITQVKHRHITVDVLYGLLPTRLRAASSILCSLIVLCVTGILAWQAILYSLRSVKIREYIAGIAAFPKYPSKVALAIGAIVFTIVIMSQLFLPRS